MAPRVDVAVVGAGVSGLTTAVCLAEAGCRVRVTADLPPERTTSAAAGAMWGPYLVEPRDKVAAWSQTSLECFTRLAADPATGVSVVSGIEAARTPAPLPDWASTVGAVACEANDLPDGYVAGWRYAVPLIDMPRYLSYLLARFHAAGGTLAVRHVTTLGQLDQAPIVVNCTGIGARHLAPDAQLVPIRGQLVVVENPGITEFFSEDTGDSPDLMHIYPFEATVVLGGVAQPDSRNLDADPGTAAAIIDRCSAVMPELRHARILEHRVGLRPTRPTIRVDEETIGGRRILHNYGHGGAGVTLSWGCAHDIVQRVRARDQAGP
jgi:D-amino-acid oxidase